MIRAGITGGIGSGKTSVCKIFEFLGVPVFYADARAKVLAREDAELRSRIIESFGKEAYAGEEYNKAYIASRVFSHPDELARLNAIIHPAVMKDWELFCRNHADRPYVIKEAAIMLESGGRDTVDKVILVSAPEELRIQRVMLRDKTGRDQILARMAAQMPELEKRKLADYIIENDGKTPLITQVLTLHRLLLNEAGLNV